MTTKTYRAAILLSATALASCASDRFYIPDEMPPPRSHEPATVETGSMIPRGKQERVRDTSQHVDVYSEEELEDDRPANTRDAVERAIRGR